MLPKLAIIAGGGDLPAHLIAACRETGRECFVLALKGQADHPDIERVPHAWIRIGAAGQGIKIMLEHDVKEIVFAGRVRRPSLRELKPDRRVAKMLAKISLNTLGDDGLMKAVVGELESDGFRIVEVEAVLKDLVAPEGVYGSKKPDKQAREDIARGIEVAKGIGALDFGQAAVVQQGVVLGVEAAEGTDALLDRCSGLRRDGPGGVLVKMRKPKQERRMDLPVIGVQTIENAAAASLRGVAVEAGGTLIVDRAAVSARADKLGLFVVGVVAQA